MLPKLPDYSLPLLSRVLATCFCATFVVIGPIAALAGHFAFLIVVFKELIFFPGAGLGAQIEATILNILGALWALGYSNAALALSRAAASRYGEDTLGSRTIVAVALLIHSYLAGYTLSKLPRLRLAARMAGFISVWVLTVQVGSKTLSYRTFTSLGFCTISAAGLSLIASLPLLRRTASPFASTVIAAFATMQELLKLSTEQMLDRYVISNHDELEALRAKLFVQSQNLNGAYTEATFELRIGRLGVESMKGFVAAVERLRADLSLGLPEFTALIEPDGTLQLFLDTVDPSARTLVHEILSSIALCQRVIGVAYDLLDPQATNLALVFPDDCLAARSTMLHASNALRTEIKRALAKLVFENDAALDVDGVLDDIFHREMFSVCLFLKSILEVASEVWLTLRLAEEVCKLHLTSPRHLQTPSLSWAWLGVAQRAASIEGSSSREDSAEQGDHSPSSGEVQEGIKEQSHTGPPITSAKRPPPSLGRFWRPRNLASSTMKLRLKISLVLRATSRSKHVKYAFKAALGTLLLCLPGFLPVDTAGRHWFDSQHGQWMVITYLFVLETDTGATLRNGLWRLVGTIIGAAYAYIAWQICRNNPYVLVFMVTLFQIPAGWVILRTSAPGAGVVASVTLPVIVFIPYLGAPHLDVLALATSRALNIALGIIAAILVHYFVFPRHTRMAFLAQVAKIIDQLSQDYIALSRPFLRTGGVSKDFRRIGMDVEVKIKNGLRMADALVNDMSLEFSLLPKPVQLYRRVATNLRRILDLFVGLRSIRQYVPPKETVTDVLNARMDLVSSVVMVLFACEHAFRSQKGLPQFMPSSRQALQELILGMKDHFRDSGESEGIRPTSIAYMFSFAESEAMAEVSEALDELLQLTTSLFGSVCWWDGEAPLLATSLPHRMAASHVWEDVTLPRTTTKEESRVLRGGAKTLVSSHLPLYSPRPHMSPSRFV